MTSAIPARPQTQINDNSAAASSSTTSAVPAQLSYAKATKTATPSTSAGGSAPTNNARYPINMAQSDSQPSNGVPNGTSNNSADHSRKPSVVINASGASGSYPNGGPVGQNSSRPAISFGSMNTGAEQQSNAHQQSQNAPLSAPRDNPRVTSPAHSPSPIPQPAASGGRPPSNLANSNNNGLAFGSMNPDTDMMRGQGPMPNVPMHERRTSSQSMQSDMSNQGMGRPPYPPAGRGSGRGFPPNPQQYMGSPGPQYRNMPAQGPRPNMPFNQQGGPPGSPFNQPAARASPRSMHSQPHMPQMGPNQQMQYPGYAGQLHPQQHQQQMYSMPSFDPYAGYYQPYYGQQGYGQPPQSPRPQYPSPFPGAPSMQPPYHPPATPGMARTPSQASERPASSMGHPQTPSQNAPAPSGTPGPNPQGPSSNFVRPVKKSSAIKITDAAGNALDFKKPSPTPSSQAQPQAPVIVSTPNAPTPPPRAASSQHQRTESKPIKTAEETKNAFADQVKRQIEEERRKAQAATDAKSNLESQKADASKKEEDEKAAAVKARDDAEKVAADKKKAEDEKSAAAEKTEAAKDAQPEDEAAKKKREEEDLERMIAEMEAEDAAREAKEAEAEKAYQEKKAKEKAAREAREKEEAANADEELKRQEREAEEREKQRMDQSEGVKKSEPDDEAKAMFASLKKSNLGPSASEAATPSGTATPASERDEEPAESAPAPTPLAPRAGGAQKPKPAHLKLETTKNVERAEPTPGMQALKTARLRELNEELKYPDGFKSPNPALNETATRKGHAYDKEFLLQFQTVFKEKPSVDWDQKIRETLGPGDEPGSARAGSARTPSGAMSRGGSGRPGQNMGQFGAMGQFGGGAMSGPRTLPAGTTSEQRFMASSQMGGAGRPGAPMGRAPSQLGMGAPGVGMSRTNSLQTMGNIGGPGSPRQPSSRGGRGGSKRDDRQKSRREEADMANKMPLTAQMEIAPLEKSQTGWKPTSIGQVSQAAAGPDPSGLMAPDMVQRKVKAALNKMTPEKFDKISDQILEIAAQSKHESDGRTLRQVIQLTFEKACDEAHWAGMYAKFCHKMLTTMSSEIRDETIKDKTGNPVVGGALFRKYLLNRCQEEFERGWQVNLPDKPEGETQEAALLSDEYYIAAAAKRRGLGLIQFIGQLYKLRMLTLRIMHECVMRLLNFEGDPDEAAVENLTTLLRAVGATMDEDDQGKNLMSTYFQRIDEVLLKNDKLGSRPRFMVMDLVDLRKAGWKGKDDAKGPKTIAQIHQEAEAAQAKAEAERAKNTRGGPGGRPPPGRGDARNFSGGGMPPPVDYNRTTVGMDDLRRLQARPSQRAAGGGLGPGGALGPSTLGGRAGSRRGAGNLAPGSSANSTRTNTPPVGDKKEEPATAQNAFSALAALDASGDQPEETTDAASPPAARNRSKSPVAADKDEA